jgi:predicted lipoprotein with Yx(FWY)xxD motif
VLAATLTPGLLLAGCGGAGSAGPGVPATTTPGATLSTEVTPVGRVLATGAGDTLYDFVLDSPSHSACVAQTCTYVWPPLTATATPTVAHGARAPLVNLLRRPDGTEQVTYGGHPLYTYTSDTAPGMVSGQGVSQSGGQWFVVAPDGRQITTSFSVVP